MSVEVIMPQMGETVAEGTILRWMVKEGDRVDKDQSIVEVSTDKVDAEVPSPAAGVMKQILGKEQETIPVGTVIAMIEEAGAETAAAAPPTPPTEAKREEAPKREAVSEEAVVTPGTGRRYSPLVKRLAKEYGIDLEQVVGTGIGGRVTKQDVLDYTGAKPPGAPAAAPPTTAPEEEVEKVEKETLVPLTPKRRIIAERMVQSKREAPHVTTTFEVDFTRIAKYRAENKEIVLKRDGVNLTYLPFVFLTTASALKEFPALNSTWTDEGIVLRKYINLGMAVSLEDGLIVPVIKDADKLDLIGLAKASQDLGQRARTKKLSPDEVQGGTFTITNYGANGSLFGNPIIVPSQVAILGMGALVKKPVVVADDAIAIRSMMYLSLSFDHRVLDGAQADQFLRKIKEDLEGWTGQPQLLHPVAKEKDQAKKAKKYEKDTSSESGFGGVW